MASNKGKYFDVRVYAPAPGEKSGVMQHKLEYRTGSQENPGGSRWAWIPASMALQTAVAILRHYKCPENLVAAVVASHNGASASAAKNGKAPAAPLAVAVAASDDSDDSLI